MFLMAGTSFEFDDTKNLMTEIISGSDRSVAIVGGALVEYVLTRVLLEYLHQDTKITDRLFHPSGALGAFASKISLAKLVGLSGPKLHADLKLIKDVRNRFAHELHIRTFEDKKIAGWCRSLTLCDSHTAEANMPSEADRAAHWQIGIVDRQSTLSAARGRFIASISVSTFALSSVRGRKAPHAPL